MRFLCSCGHVDILKRWSSVFFRREITALVGGPGNMAVYRHILVIPPTVKIVTAEKRRTAYRQNIAAVLHYRRKNTDIFWFYRFRQSSYRQKQENRQPRKNYRRMAISPRLCPPNKTLPTTTLNIFTCDILPLCHK